MNQTSSFVRKVVYLGVVVALLLPLAWLSMPSSPARNGGEAQPGGQLAQLRAKYNLANQQLGNIDPTSATINLATFGFRGVAANILWTKANEYKKVEDWSNMKATVDTIVRLQPFFISVWRFQAWNISYNVSVEWDDYRDRYFWVMEGVRFLQRGTDVNNDDPSLLYDTGWFISHKIGKSDEQKQFRWLFVRDDDFQGNRPRDQRDNWLVGKEFYRRAEKMRDAGRIFRGTSPLIFYATPGLNNFYYAIGQADDGRLDEVLRRAWNNGFMEWASTEPLSNAVQPLGARPIQLALDIPEVTRGSKNRIQLNREEEYRAQSAQLQAKLDALLPGVRDQIFAEKKAKLNDEERVAWDRPEAERSPKERDLVYYATDKLRVQPAEIAARAPAEKKKEASDLAAQINDAEVYAHWINRYRDVINFVYWRTRCLAERTEDALAARRLEDEAKLANQNAALFEAREAYSRCLEHWRVLMQAFPQLAKDSLTAEDLLTLTKTYRETIPWARPSYEIENNYLPLGYGFVSVDEILDWPGFVARLAEKGPQTAPSWEHTLWTAMPESLQRALSNAAASKTPLDLTTQLDVLYALNEQLCRPDFYQADQFAGVTVPEEFQKILALPNTVEDRAPHDLRIANRKILEASLGPQLLAVAPLNRYILAAIFDQHKEITETNQLSPPPSLPARSYNFGEAAAPKPAEAPMAPATPPAAPMPATPAPAAPDAPATPAPTPAPATPAPTGEAPATPAAPAPATPAPATPAPSPEAPATPAPAAPTPETPAPAAPEAPATPAPASPAPAAPDAPAPATPDAPAAPASGETPAPAAPSETPAAPASE
ncbi:MAG TPA: hypothetical protein VGE52_01720 [Pirellulales bacterium]